jgi:flagellum-specific ATP synthase
VLAGAGKVRERLAVHRQNEDLITVGAYQRGTDPRVDDAIEHMPAIEAFLRQGLHEHVPLEEVDRAVLELAASPPAVIAA